ncbi:YxiJ family protein [Paenibacillus sp. NPDC056579]|uniref:YxiJ family protein n=1 Tax=Paenibacillus sp. NPDC056579 TaxID=3345871 RepID=UPI0036BD1B48
MNIAGTLSFVLTAKTKEIPQRQIEKLELSFFRWFPQYKFVEESVCEYKEFYMEYKNFELA